MRRTVVHLPYRIRSSRIHPIVTVLFQYFHEIISVVASRLVIISSDLRTVNTRDICFDD